MSPTSSAQEAISQRAFREYLRVFGRQPRVVDLPRIYMELKDAFDSEMIPEDLFSRFRRALNYVELETDDEPSLLAIADQGGRLLTNLRLLDSRGKLSAMRWRQVTEDYSLLLRTLVAGKELYWAPRPLRGRDGVRWIRLRNASPRQAEMEQIRREDPTLFQRIHESKEQREAIDAAIGKKIIGTGQIPARQRIRGRWMLVGIDPALVPDKVEVKGKLIPGAEAMRLLDDPSVVASLPDEAVDVYKDDGKTVSREQFAEDVDKENAAHGALLNVNALVRPNRRGNPQYVDPSVLRRVNDEDFIAAFGENPEPDDYVSLTDDPRKETALTKIYPVKKYRGKQIITSGRFKGVYVSDLINRAGRLIEGSITYYNPDTGELERREVTNPDGSVEVRKILEPYVTVDRGRLMLTLSREKGYATILRNALFNLSKLVPSIQYEEGTGRSVFTFDPKDFGSIRDAIGAMALSNAASRMLQDYFDKLTKAERATEDKNLQKYSGQRLGLRTNLRRQQAQAVAWLDANDNTGICALDTGVGKCVREDTLVLTGRGLVPIGDLNPGLDTPDASAPVWDRHVLVNGKKLPISSFYYGGVKPTLRVTTRSGYTVEGSRTHPLLVRLADGTEDWVRTPDLRAGDFLCVERKPADFPETEPVVPIPDLDLGPHATNYRTFDVPDRLTPDLAGLLGWLVAEGWVNDRARFKISQCPDRNPEARSEIVRLVEQVLQYPCSKQRGIDLEINSVFLRAYLSGMGVGNGLAKDKSVPDPVLRGTREGVRRFLQALFDAEAFVAPDRRTIEFTTASERLGREVQVLLLRFGVVCSRRPKRVAGYEQRYWRLTLTGDDAARFAESVGFVSERKIAATHGWADHQNANTDTIPYAAQDVGFLWAVLSESFPGTSSDFRSTYGHSIYSTIHHIRMGRRSPTYRFIEELLGVAATHGLQDHPAYQRLQGVLDRRFFYDPISELVEAEAVVVDIEVGDPSHTFIGNGLVNHNTGVAIATMQNLRRKGLDSEGNGRFLFVCKRALAGNLPKEIEKFLSPDEAPDLIEMTDIITYLEFNKRQNGTASKPPTDPGFADNYVAIFFDEAHERFKKKESAFYKAVSACKAPRKILLTASPMVRSPSEVFTLSSVANGVDLNTREGRAQERLFMRRFAETVGGRTVGIKRADTSRDTYNLYVRKEEMAGRTPVPYEEWPGEVDVAAARDFNTWVKTNLFYASKRDVLDEKGEKLKDLNVVPPVAVTMPPEIESVYRETMDEVVGALREITSKKYQGNLALAIEAAKVKLRKPLALLTKLSDVPNRVIPGAPNPKINQAKSIVEQVSGRTILFTDSPAMAEDTQAEMAKAFPGKGHAVAYADAIVVTKATGETIRYTPRRYPDPSRPQPRGAGSIMEIVNGKISVRRNEDPNRKGFALAKRDDWKVVVLQKYVQKDPTVATLVLTGTYAVGQNLQAFTNVIHLDRDDWSNETMKQRSARAWRAGQSEVVNEYTLDLVYGDAVSNDDADKTLDEIRSIIQGMDEDLFNEVVVDSQVERIGQEWAEVKKQRSLLHKIDRQMMERALSPYANQLGRQE